MALKKSRVRVSLAPFFLVLSFLLSCVFSPSASAQKVSSKIPDLVAYVIALPDGTLKISIAYRDLVSRNEALKEGETLAKNLSLTLVAKPSVKIEKGGDGLQATSIDLRGRGQLPARDAMPDLLPFLSAFRTRRQMALIVPADIKFDADRQDRVAQNEAYRVQWDRTQDGAYQYRIDFRDREATLPPPVFHIVARQEVPVSGSLQTSDPPLQNAPQKMILFVLALLAGISLVGGVLLLIRRGRVTAH